MDRLIRKVHEELECQELCNEYVEGVDEGGGDVLQSVEESSGVG